MRCGMCESRTCVYNRVDLTCQCNVTLWIPYKISIWTCVKRPVVFLSLLLSGWQNSAALTLYFRGVKVMEIQRAYHPFLLVHWIVCLIQNHPHFVFCTRHQIQKFTTVSYGSWPVCSMSFLSAGVSWKTCTHGFACSFVGFYYPAFQNVRGAYNFFIVWVCLCIFLYCLF